MALTSSKVVSFRALSAGPEADWPCAAETAWANTRIVVRIELLATEHDGDMEAKGGPDSCVLDRASEMGAVSSRADKLVLFIM